MDSTVKRAATEIIDPNNSKKPKLIIKCDDDDSHIADLYCTKCNVNLCKTCCDRIHSSKAVSNHKIIKLAEKPEVVCCHLHPETRARLVCKEPDCVGVNNTICVFCHRYEKHKDHEYELVNVEYDKVRADITTFVEETEKKIKNCNRIIDECEKAIPTYSSTDDDFMKEEKDKIEKFYSDAKASALEELENFANTRIETLKSLQSHYSNDRRKLDHFKNALLNFEKSSKQSAIKNFKQVEIATEKLVREKDDESIVVRSLNCYKIEYPESVNIKIGISSSESDQYQNQQDSAEDPTSDTRAQDPTSDTRAQDPTSDTISDGSTSDDSSDDSTSHSPDNSVDANNESENVSENREREKIIAVYSANPSLEVSSMFQYEMDNRTIEYVADSDDGELFMAKNGQRILVMETRPNEDEIDLTKYEYVAVVGCWTGEPYFGKDLLREELKNQWCSRIIALLNSFGCNHKEECMSSIREIAETDKRVFVSRNCENNSLDWFLLD